MICGMKGCPGAMLRRLCTNKDTSTYITLEQNQERRRKRQADARAEKKEAALVGSGGGNRIVLPTVCLYSIMFVL